jgi:heat shock protein HtpX
MNGVKTVLLLGLLSGLFLVAGSYIGGQQGMYWGLALAVITNAVSYFFSDKIALSMYSAQPVSPSANAEIYSRLGPLVQNLTQRMSLPMPKLWVIPEDSPNAFATGRNPAHASVAVTAGILRLMNDQELEGVLAHELGHVLHRDILISSVAATMAAALMTISRMAMWFGGGSRDDDDRPSPVAAIAMMIVAPFAALLIQMAISRTREYAADAAAAKYTGGPIGLVGALQELETGARRIPMEANPATAHMFIIQPFIGGIARLFSSHPPTEKRIARLMELR